VNSQNHAHQLQQNDADIEDASENKGCMQAFVTFHVKLLYFHSNSFAFYPYFVLHVLVVLFNL